MRNVACALHVSIRKGNSGDRLTFERLKASGVYGPAVSIEGWADQPLGQVTLRDIDVAYKPDLFTDPRVEGRLKVQPLIRQPGAGIFARKLPVWGFYGRGIDDLHLERVRFTTDGRDDPYPVVRADNIEKLRLEHLQNSPVPDKSKVVECHDVGVVLRDDTPQAPSAPRTGRAKAKPRKASTEFR
jgi:hypothetical protein